MTKVAFIGLGRMGHGPWPARYLDVGFTVAIWNRSKAKAERPESRAAARDGPVRRLMPPRAADAVVTMVRR